MHVVQSAADPDLGRAALRDRRKPRITDRDLKTDAVTARVVRPLALACWVRVWTLATWCELRTDFRSFRLDRIGELEVLDAGFEEEPGRTLDDFIRHVTKHPAPSAA